MKKDKKVYVIFGPLGSGKTNVAALLSSQLKLNHISWGRLYRDQDFRKKNKKAFDVIDDAKTTTTERSRMIGKLIRSQFKYMFESNDNDFVLEGYPRRYEEAKELVKILKEHDIFSIEALMKINPSFLTIQKRLAKRYYCVKCKRYYEDIEKNENICSFDGGVLKHRKDSVRAAKREFDSYNREIINVINYLDDISNFNFDVSGDTSSVVAFSNIIYKLMKKEKSNVVLFKRMNETTLETKYGLFRLIAYQSRIDYGSHLVITKGKIKGARALPVRVHSSCITGDILGSSRCDCGDQLHFALKKINKLGRGAVIYLFQEGRGINIINKIDTYKLQREGVDTVDANEILGFPAEMREYTAVKDILCDLDIKSIRLMTNNPDKTSKLTDLGVTVEGIIPVEIPANHVNKKYLQTKKDRMDHEFKQL